MMKYLAAFWLSACLVSTAANSEASKFSGISVMTDKGWLMMRFSDQKPFHCGAAGGEESLADGIYTTQENEELIVENGKVTNLDSFPDLKEKYKSTQPLVCR